MPSHDDAEAPGSENRFWHLDRGIPLAMIVGMILQTGTVVWWAAHLDSRVGNLEAAKVARDAQLAGIDAKLLAGDSIRNDLNVRLIHVEDKTIAVLDAVAKVDIKVDKLVENISNGKKSP